MSKMYTGLPMGIAIPASLILWYFLERQTAKPSTPEIIKQNIRSLVKIRLISLQQAKTCNRNRPQNFICLASLHVNIYIIPVL